MPEAKDYKCTGQWSYWYDKPEAKIRLALAGVQGGKTEAGCIALAKELKENKNEQFMVVAPTYKVLSQATLIKLEEILKTIHPNWIVKRDEKVKMEWRDRNGNVIFLRSADTPDHLRGPTLKSVFFDECAMVPTVEVYRILYQRIAVKRGNLWMTTTPKGPNWLLREVIRPWQNGDPNYHLAKWRSIDNPAFPKEVYENAKKYQDERWVKQEYDAELSDIGGLVFSEFDEEEHTGLFEYNPDWPIYWGVDFGIGNPCYIGFFQIDESYGDHGFIYMIDELQLQGLKFPDVLPIALNEKGYLKDPSDEVLTPYPKPEMVFCDPSGRYREKIAGIGTMDVMMLPEYGFNLTVITEENWNTHQMRILGINEMHQCLRDRTIKFHRERCWNMIRAFSLYSRPTQKEGKRQDEMPIKDGVSDHPMEATFYFLLGRPKYFDRGIQEPLIVEPSSDWTGI